MSVFAAPFTGLERRLPTPASAATVRQRRASEQPPVRSSEHLPHEILSSRRSCPQRRFLSLCRPHRTGMTVRRPACHSRVRRSARIASLCAARRPERNRGSGSRRGARKSDSHSGHRGERILPHDTVRNIESWRFEDDVTTSLTTQFIYELERRPGESNQNPPCRSAPSPTVRIIGVRDDW